MLTIQIKQVHLGETVRSGTINGETVEEIAIQLEEVQENLPPSDWLHVILPENFPEIPKVLRKFF